MLQQTMLASTHTVTMPAHTHAAENHDQHIHAAIDHISTHTRTHTHTHTHTYTHTHTHIHIHTHAASTYLNQGATMHECTYVMYLNSSHKCLNVNDPILPIARLAT